VEAREEAMNGPAKNGRARPARRLQSIAAMLLVAALRAAAQEKATAADPSSTRRIIISIPDRKLALTEDGRLLRVYPVAVGARVSPSPTGEFKIVSRIIDPTYYHPGIVIPPGRNNPLGTRWIGLDRKGYGIHGTNEPRSIGKAASHGCIRMAKADLEQFFTEVRVGDVVEIRGQRDSQTAAIFGARQAAIASVTARATSAPAAYGGQI
jgi:lipoprotein-anchoring transpeptidase ErfK/SrfK